ncbi:phytanoyl-CoA dioxygenase family protein [Legionella quateirensis]|uniref:Phytanoyl-CoA dioxygenase n=2 Tax=Legionella quateirensis TaxID=45072 RepID=A0A378KW09_9GAMM|nr:phytanoyl-CoA dioxygenase family protein [Legionella quateirensis]KTD46457.1 phytanoyl-CoA dioxygenase [Legionella quateirensis]STY18762.1 phytanoyl-CoA dioxygenase [Legionella quateirensis]
MIPELKLHQYTKKEILYKSNQLMTDYEHYGIIYLNNFLDSSDLGSLLTELNHAKNKAEEDIRTLWGNRQVVFYSKNAVKSTAPAHDYVTEDYFLQSHNKAHVFYEMHGDRRYVNRIGHGLHLMESFYTLRHLVYHNPYLATVLKTIGFIKPICHLSVYIPKHAYEIGSVVRPHQESTFAYTEPQSVVVLWMALEDATLQNACMWGIPGSNKWPLQYVSRVDHQLKIRKFERLNVEMEIPDFELQGELFMPLEVKAGDALLFHGNFIHCSPVNRSACSRSALSLQFIETHNVQYPGTNWLQPRNNQFIYDLSLAQEHSQGEIHV